jgi:hypothetical protein
MAFEFKRITGIDPLTAYLPTAVEAASPEEEIPEYKQATQNGWISRPTVFVDEKGKPWAHGSSDMTIFFPRTVYEQGRPDWLRRELGRAPVPIPTGLVRGQGYRLIQAWNVGEPTSAAAVDQIAVRPGDPVPVLMLPRAGRFRVRAIDPEGKASEWRTVRS